jgi:hypothetical protein
MSAWVASPIGIADALPGDRAAAPSAISPAAANLSVISIPPSKEGRKLRLLAEVSFRKRHASDLIVM